VLGCTRRRLDRHTRPGPRRRRRHRPLAIGQKADSALPSSLHDPRAPASTTSIGSTDHATLPRPVIHPLGNRCRRPSYGRRARDTTSHDFVDLMHARERKRDTTPRAVGHLLVANCATDARGARRISNRKLRLPCSPRIGRRVMSSTRCASRQARRRVCGLFGDRAERGCSTPIPVTPASWPLRTIAGGVGVAAETAALVLGADAYIASVGA
jgi:hypothetical protein